ncbi:MAG: hypothetical protein DI585_00135 [Pseudomonas fluorescens]|nr:MAG: hypothetical protein DI585_00135 [Pseudomonas fluorescens]
MDMIPDLHIARAVVAILADTGNRRPALPLQITLKAASYLLLAGPLAEDQCVLFTDIPELPSSMYEQIAEMLRTTDIQVVQINEFDARYQRHKTFYLAYRGAQKAMLRSVVAHDGNLTCTVTHTY